MRYVFLALLILISIPSYSHEVEYPCQHKQTTIEIVECLHKHVLLKESELEALENKIKLNLKKEEDINKKIASIRPSLADVKLLDTFQSARQAFQNYKTSHCMYAMQRVLGGTAMPINSLDCQLNVIKSRIEDLRRISGEK